MRINRKKNGYIIKVDNWSSDIVILKGEKIIDIKTFSDHIKACLVAKAL